MNSEDLHGLALKFLRDGGVKILGSKATDKFVH